MDVKKAIEHFKGKRYGAAERILRQAYEASPDRRIISYYLAQIEIKKKAFRPAAHKIGRLLSADPHNERYQRLEKLLMDRAEREGFIFGEDGTMILDEEVNAAKDRAVAREFLRDSSEGSFSLQDAGTAAIEPEFSSHDIAVARAFMRDNPQTSQATVNSADYGVFNTGTEAIEPEFSSDDLAAARRFMTEGRQVENQPAHESIPVGSLSDNFSNHPPKPPNAQELITNLWRASDRSDHVTTVRDGALLLEISGNSTKDIPGTVLYRIIESLTALGEQLAATIDHATLTPPESRTIRTFLKKMKQVDFS